DIEEDGDVPFGMVCDILVKEEYRGHGAGEALLQTAISWLRSRGINDIYLESGKNNHSAHRFFEKRGFSHVSEIYKLF
ncbi:MAG: GNAT family N-acetyltransferase, partial [Bacteroidales bacterium]|nr:GNAT family N-acetyltransferase [Bacteroidales bacterium]